MYLVVNEVKSDIVDVNVTFEKVVDDLILVSIEINSTNKNIPSYWRLTGVVGVPPLEIGIDNNNGEIIRVVCFIEPSQISLDSDIKITSMNGNIRVKTNIFKKVNDYVDVDKVYNFYLHKDKLICMFQQMNGLTQTFKNNRLELHTDNKMQVVGFSVCDLQENEYLEIYNMYKEYLQV